jgi:hypothetical protein
MARVTGDTVEMAVTSDDEESESEEDPNLLQQALPGSVHVEDSRDIHIGPQLTYNGPVTVNQIVQVPGGNSGYNENIQHAFLTQDIDAPGSYTDPLSRTEGNITKHNACLETRSEQTLLCGNPFRTSSREVPSSSVSRDARYPQFTTTGSFCFLSNSLLTSAQPFVSLLNK